MKTFFTPVTVFIYIFLLIFVSCATQKIDEWNNRSSISRMDNLIEMEGSSENDFDSMTNDLGRSARVLNGKYEDKFKLIPFTKPFIVSLSVTTVMTQAYQEKWSEKKALQNTLATASLLNAFQKGKTCFMFIGEFQNPEAKNNKFWHFTLISEDINIKANHFKKYTGFNSVTSKLCFPIQIDFSKPFHIIVEPRYELSLTPVKLSWTSSP